MRDVPEQKNAEGMGKALGYLRYLTQHLGKDSLKEEKRSKAMGEAVRFLTDMDRSYLGQVRPRFGKRSKVTLTELARMVRKHNPRYQDPLSLVALINQLQMEIARRRAEEENAI